ncbi:cytochrome-c oxidase, cbb3-type subunit III [Hyphomicrobium sp.]|uniref:cytochrome-c oxidase, cbb3-type subunit III n=1 Tax=Hyphomicrobium sp. TaxID=82 RepID=UPI0025C2C9E8|nr:cytochrome-c oxidase, cbb3-type subunit III [Hyphomicrobium sp.]MCC7253849.1 cytochrome-c oxidase, cbb3-type subunit III [Hyphomicrobium sp.]
MAGHKEVDAVTGIETTGHVWDGDLKELNKPLPRWWLYVLYATIIWSIGYWILYPAWPLVDGYTQGVLGYSQRSEVTRDVAAAKESQTRFVEAIAAREPADIAKDPDLMEFVLRGGAAQFANNCAPCHGRGAQGFKGYPNLNDDDWLWGGTVADIEATIRNGIRSGHAESRESAMPRFGLDQVLTNEQIADTATFVLSLSGQPGDAPAAERGKAIFAEQCVACHGEEGKGMAELGAPNLTDAIWLYGGGKADVEETIRTGRTGVGVMPAWDGKLDPVTIKMLAIYVHALGGGK